MQMKIAEFMDGAMFYAYILVKLFPLYLARIQLSMYMATAIIPVFLGVVVGCIMYDGDISLSDFLA